MRPSQLRRAELLDATVRRRAKCAQCDMRDDCIGGCPAVNVALTGSVLDPAEEECTLTRMVYRVKLATAEIAGHGGGELKGGRAA